MKKAAVVLPFLLLGCSSEPKTYEDCILKYMKSNLDRAAVVQIQKACEAKYPRTANSGADKPSGSLFDQELEKYNAAYQSSAQEAPAAGGK